VAKKKKTEALPLDSPNWWPMAAAHAERCKPAGSRTFAARDLTEALRKERIRSMLRRYRTAPAIWGHGPPPPEQTLLSKVYWRDHQLESWGDRLVVVPSPRRRGSLNFVGGCEFYVWLPDYKKIFDDPHARLSSSTQTQEVPEKRGRKATLPWTKIGFELVRRAEKMGAAAGNKSTNSWAIDLDQWCDDHKLKAPPNSELRVFVDDVLRALRIERK
jgi:hypothetical protein